MEYPAQQKQVIIVGAGHAGVEAALASARLGCDTALFTLNLDAIANMPCNPSIGGTGKGHLVYEIDALGGEMGRAADKACLQSRMLNLAKGPAVHSLRFQADRRKYQEIMKQTLENTRNLAIVQGEIVSLRKNGDWWEVVTRLGAVWSARAVVLCTGTYLNGRIVVGETNYAGGPDGMFPAGFLSDSLKRLSIPLLRFKTGTPVRLHADSIDFTKLEIQYGDVRPAHFSDDTVEFDLLRQLPCYVAYTNERTHAVIRANLHRSPLYSGVIKGTGPRYCPSIEDKVVRFADKQRHQLFLEPMGANTKEMYLQGFSSSLPEEVQVEMLHTIDGFEHAQIMRIGYAIEYDCVDPLCLSPSLMFKEHSGLFGAGQFNGTSGYEEAAAQGLVAGINAARYGKGEPPFILTRSSSYIGTLIDDLVTKGTNEPYRMMTSRTEYRLLLRQDNAGARLIPQGFRLGLVSEKRYRAFLSEKDRIDREIQRLNDTFVAPDERVASFLQAQGSAPIETGVSLAELLRRPEIRYDELAKVDAGRPALTEKERAEVEIEVKYEGYIRRQIRQAEHFAKVESKKIPDDIDYEAIPGIRAEARQKLAKIRPINLGQASRISGVSPADLSVLMIYLNIR